MKCAQCTDLQDEEEEEEEEEENIELLPGAPFPGGLKCDTVQAWFCVSDCHDTSLLITV